MSGQLIQVQQEYHVQDQDLGSLVSGVGAPKFKVFVGGYADSVQMRILDTININLIPMRYVSFFNFDTTNFNTTNDKLFISEYGQDFGNHDVMDKFAIF